MFDRNEENGSSGQVLRCLKSVETVLYNYFGTASVSHWSKQCDLKADKDQRVHQT